MHATFARLTRLAGDLARAADGQLLDAFLRGSQPAFRELVDRHGPLVFAVCNRVLRHPQDAEDAFQAVFLVLARRAADVWPRDAVGSWLYGVAHRVALKARATRARRSGRERPLEDVAAPEAIIPEPDTAEAIDRAVRKLPEVYRAAVVACDLEGLSRAEAAARLGWKEGTLSGRLARARQLLADRLRKVGLSLPAAGLAVALGTTAPVRAGLMESVIRVASGRAAGGVPAPVAALTEGVIPGMFALKLKAAAAAVVIACTVGVGAWAGGPGDGPGAATGQPLAAAQPAGVQPAKAKAEPPPAPKADTPLRNIQGKWRILAITEGKNSVTVPKDARDEIEISGNTFSMPYREAGGGRKREQFRIAVDDTKTPATIDLIVPGKPVGRGIYQMIATTQTCATCHKAPYDNTTPWDLLALCPPGARGVKPEQAVALRLAVATAGPRPAKFKSGAEGVIEFSLERVADDDEVKQLEREQARLEAFRALMGQARDEVQRAELERLVRQLELARLNRDETNAQKRVEEARARVAQAQAVTEQAQLELQIATQGLKAAKDKLAAAEKAVEGVKKNPPAAPGKQAESFTIHVRLLDAPEKVVSLPAANVTVLDALNKAGDSVPLIRGPEGLQVWVTRDGKIMPVDLGGIVNKNETATNYVLKPGDRVFVQVKLGK